MTAFLAAVLSLVAATESSSERMEALLTGNTLIVANRFGPVRIHYSPDHTFEAAGQDWTGIDGSVSKGLWRATAEGVCVRTLISAPDQFGWENCLDLRGRKLGDQWRGKDDPRNGPIAFRLVRGRAAPLAPNFGGVPLPLPPAR